MSREWRTILRFALLGLGLAVAFFIYFETDPVPVSSLAVWTGGAALILCPGSLLFVTAIDIEPRSTGFAFMWLVIALINCALYAVIGAAYIGLRKKPEGSSSV